ncbi:MAG: mismatch repair protein MutL [Acidobacteriota bacterium]|nr:mismatch repair protein MutL [Acidobacteriota bacterium]
MSKIRVLSDNVANQIAAGEVVERPASVAKELVENSIDAGARRVEVDVEAGGRRLLRVSDDGDGMTRDDAVLCFERHATSKITTAEDLERVSTLGFRGEALASIASVARVELVTQEEGGAEGTRVAIEGGRMRDVAPAARPRGTTIAVRDLFFNLPARRKFLRSEATESFHLTNLVTHYALAHPEIAFTLTSNGREVLRAGPAADLRERAYQIFGAEFIESLLEVGGGRDDVARVVGYVSAPRARRTTRDAQYLFVNGRYVRDRLIMRALSEGYRSVLPHGVYPSALLFLKVPPAEVDVNVHPAKTEVRFRRASAVADAVRESVRAALFTGGFLRADESLEGAGGVGDFDARQDAGDFDARQSAGSSVNSDEPPASFANSMATAARFGAPDNSLHSDARAVPPSIDASDDPFARRDEGAAGQESIEFGWTPATDESAWPGAHTTERTRPSPSSLDAAAHNAGLTPSPPAQRTSESLAASESPFAIDSPSASESTGALDPSSEPGGAQGTAPPNSEQSPAQSGGAQSRSSSTRARVVALPPLNSAAGLVREAAVDSLTPNIRPLGQLDESFIIATDADGLLLIDQHVAHERILFDKYRRLEASRRPDSQSLLVPETFDLTPAQAAAFDEVSAELERLGFSLMRLSGRTVAVRAVPADLPATEARNLLAEILDTVDAEKRGRARDTLGDEIAASLACRAAIKINMPLTQEKMRWLIDRLLLTSSPTTCPHGRPIILRLTKRDIERGFHRP